VIFDLVNSYIYVLLFPVFEEIIGAFFDFQIWKVINNLFIDDPYLKNIYIYFF